MKKKIIFVVAMFAFFPTLVACGGTQEATKDSAKTFQRSKKVEEKVTITVKNEKKQVIAKKVFIAKKGETLLEYGKKNLKIKDTDGFIQEIDGVRQDESKNLYWMFKVNGKLSPVGAKEVQLKAGDTVEFYLEAYQQ